MNSAKSSKRQFNNLKFDLINEILSSVAIKQIMTSIIKINKRILNATKSKAYLNLLVENSENFISTISYDYPYINEIKAEFTEKSNLSCNIMEEIIEHLLAEKYKKYDYIYLQNDFLLHKKSKFIYNAKSLKANILKKDFFNYNTETSEDLMIFEVLTNVLGKNMNIYTLILGQRFFEMRNDRIVAFKKLLLDKKNGIRNSITNRGEDFTEAIKEIIMNNK